MINPATLTPKQQLHMWGYDAEYDRHLHIWHLTFTDSGWCCGTAATIESARDWIGWHKVVMGEWLLVTPTACPICDNELTA